MTDLLLTVIRIILVFMNCF